jgi:hypothetical protein
MGQGRGPPEPLRACLDSLAGYATRWHEIKNGLMWVICGEKTDNMARREKSLYVWYQILYL